MKTPICDYFDIKTTDTGEQITEVYIKGNLLLRQESINKGTAFTKEERNTLGLNGLLPTHVNTLEQQLKRVYRGFQRENSPLAKYQYLRSLQDRSEILFYALVSVHLEEMLPIIYTPTVGEAVKEFSHRYQSPRGLSFSPDNIQYAHSIIKHSAWNDIRMIVATDSSAILGIGDQGYGGLAIAIGKLAIYTVGGGVSPYQTMPVKLDVGTNRKDLIDDEFYLGIRQPRLHGENYMDFIDQFVESVQTNWPKAIIQWEDLSKDVAFSVLERFRHKISCFNDDIQGTGAVALAGVLSACQLKKEAYKDQTIVISGAGAGGIGVAWALRQGLIHEGLSADEARERVFVLDSRGLLVQNRAMDAYKMDYAQTEESIKDWQYEGDAPSLLDTIESSKATILLGLSGQSGTFNECIVKAVYKNTNRPVIFPMSNPTTSSEGLPDDIIAWTDGNAIVATGSPFPAVEYKDKTYFIGQGNNAFVFPGIGLAAILCQATHISDEMILTAAYALADYTQQYHLSEQLIYPPIDELQKVSIRVASKVMEIARDTGISQCEASQDCDCEAYVRAHFWHPQYPRFIAGEKSN